jgi:hypothetical protein
MEFDYWSLLLILGSFGIFSFSWLIRAKISQNDPKQWKQRYDQEVENTKYWRGKFNAEKRRTVELDGEYQVTGEQDAGIAISALADSILPMLPDGVRKLIKNPDTLNMIAGFASKHPEIVNKILGGLTKKKSANNGAVTEEPETSEDTA